MEFTKFYGDDNFDSSPDNVLQVVSKLITPTYAVSVPISTDTLICSDFFMDFVPMGNNSTVHVEMRWFGERTGAEWDTMFNIYRDSNRLNCGANNTQAKGIACIHGAYFNNQATTPDNGFITTTDTGGTVIGVPIKYSLYIITGQACTCYTNRTVNISTSLVDDKENGTSEIIITEYGA